MRKILLSAVLLLFFISNSMAQCHLDKFRWNCEIPLHIRPHPGITSLIHCGHLSGWVNARQWEIITRYQKANVEMNLMINNEYIDSPCTASEK